MAFPSPFWVQPIQRAILLAFHNQTNIRQPQALCEYLSSQCGLDMAYYICKLHPHHPFQPASWTRTDICSLQEYTCSQWSMCNSFIYRVNQAAPQALHRLSIHQSDMQHIMAYQQYQLTRLHQLTAPLNPQHLQDQAGEHILTSILKQEYHDCSGTITKYFMECTAGMCLAEPPDQTSQPTSPQL